MFGYCRFACLTVKKETKPFFRPMFLEVVLRSRWGYLRPGVSPPLEDGNGSGRVGGDEGNRLSRDEEDRSGDGRSGSSVMSSGGAGRVEER
jgi:hypothetical protein